MPEQARPLQRGEVGVPLGRNLQLAGDGERDRLLDEDERPTTGSFGGNRGASGPLQHRAVYEVGEGSSMTFAIPAPKRYGARPVCPLPSL